MDKIKLEKATFPEPSALQDHEALEPIKTETFWVIADNRYMEGAKRVWFKRLWFDGRTLRAIAVDDKPWFVAGDALRMARRTPLLGGRRTPLYYYQNEGVLQRNGVAPEDRCAWYVVSKDWNVRKAQFVTLQGLQDIAQKSHPKIHHAFQGYTNKSLPAEVARSYALALSADATPSIPEAEVVEDLSVISADIGSEGPGLTAESPAVTQLFYWLGNPVRTINWDDKFLFVARDIVLMLGYKNVTQTLQQHGLMNGVSPRYAIDGKGRLQRMLCIKESGMYRLTMRSNMPRALEFTDLVTEQVLPSIRTHGAYISPSAHLPAALLPKNA